MKTKFFLIPFLSSFAFVFGFINTPQKEQLTTKRKFSQRAVSSVEMDFTSYETLPCPTQDEAQAFLTQANIKDVNPVFSCENNNQVTKLFKLFKLASILRVHFPEGWAGSAQTALNTVSVFISKSTPELHISQSASHAIASNYNGSKIELGFDFFKLPPMKALEVLIHENRHTHPDSAPHVPCFTGDLPKSGGACDSLFFNDAHSGAYSFGTLFSLGYSLFGIDISEGTRQQLMNSALSVLSTRFNNVPYNMGTPLDLLYVLKENGLVYQVHPFTFELIPIEISTLPGESITRIQYGPLDSGLLAFTDQGHVYAVSQNGEQVDYYSSLILKPELFIIDSNKVYTSSADYSFSFFVEKNGTLYFKDSSSSTGENVLVTFRKNLPIQTKRFFGALGTKMLALTQNGEIYQFLTGGGPGGQLPRPLKNAVLPGVEWRDAHGGVTYDLLYTVGTDGLVYLLKQSLFDNESFIESDFLVNDKFEKFQESLNIKIGLAESGKLFAWDLDRTTEQPWPLPINAIKDFAIGRSYSPSHRLAPLLSQESNTLEACGVIKTFLDPWTKRSVGFSKTGQLIFQSISGQCQNYKETAFDGTFALGTKVLTKINTLFDSTYLRLQTKDGKETLIFPYKKDL